MGGKSGGSQTIGYWYRLGCQTAVSHSPVDGVSQIVFGERTAWSGFNSGGEINIDRLDLFGGEKREGGVKGRVAINMGLPNQAVDRYVAANRGETSAQRGILTMVFGDTGQAPPSNLRAINFQMSAISTTAENRIGATPKGILTVVGREMTRAQAKTYVGRFYSPVNTSDNDEMQDQYDIYGSWRAVALMYTYRIFVLNNLEGAWTNNISLSSNDFFSVEERLPQIDAAYSEPFWWSAMNPYFKALWVRVQNIFAGWTLPNGCWYRDKAAIAGSQHRMDNGTYLPINDMNPAHIIYNILTNNVWGMGYTASDIDEASFKAAADTLFNERFGMSLAWRREEVIEEFINIILKTIDAFLRVNVLTGKFQLVLIRGNYDINKLPVIDENIIMKLEKYERSSWGDTPNEIVLTYRDRLEESAVITVQNLAAIETQGSVISTTVEYIGIHEPELAGRIAERELINASTPIAKVTITVNRMAFLLQAGDVFNFKWKKLGITQMAMRVISINKGTFDDGTIQIEAMEDVFGLPSSTYISEQESLWTDVYATPVPIANAKVWEAPYYDIVHRVGEAAAQQGISQGYTFARLFADMPNSGTPIYVLTGATRNNDSDYATILNSASYQANFTLLDRVSRTATKFSISAVENMPDKINANDYIVIDDEVMGIVKIDNTNGTITVTRGNLDTIPEIHKVGATGWIVKPNENQDETFRTLGEMVYYKPLTVTTRGTLPITQATPFSMSLIGRSDRPYPVAGVKFNGQYFISSIKNNVNLRLTWDGRNRQMVKLNHWTYGNIQEEAGVTYSVKIYNPFNNKVFYDDTGLTVRDKTYLPPKQWVKFTLPTSISGLVYHYDFENDLNPVAGSNNNSMVVSNTKTVTGASSTSKALQFSSAYARLPFDASMNTRNLTIGFRVMPSGTYLPICIFEGSSGTNSMRFGVIVVNGTLTVYFGTSYTNSPFKATATLPAKEYSDVLVICNPDTSYISIWVDGVKVTNTLQNSLFSVPTYLTAGAENLWINKNAVVGFVTDTGSISSPDYNNLTSDFIPVTPNDKYVYQLWRGTTGGAMWTGYVFYDSNKQKIGTRTIVTTSTTQNGVLYQKVDITAPANAAYIRIGSREALYGRMMFTTGTTVPIYNIAENDTDTLFQMTDAAWIGVFNQNSYANAGSQIDDFFMYNRALTDAEINQINAVMIKQAWSEQVTVEMKTVRDNLNSWQTFKHTFSSAE